MANAESIAATQTSEVDRLRVNIYRLLARALSSPPKQHVLDAFARLEGDDTDLGHAFADLAMRASGATVQSAAEEYQELFIGIGRGELVPYGSYYLTGFLNEKPLARLRNDMAALGIERSPGVMEPEDHAGALMDMMAGLIDGTFGRPRSLGQQRDFFDRHIGPWLAYFFRDLAGAGKADLYRPIGRIGQLFLELEEAAFEM